MGLGLSLEQDSGGREAVQDRQTALLTAPPLGKQIELVKLEASPPTSGVSFPWEIKKNQMAMRKEKTLCL